jgi:malonyl-CoA/methylmalonyl-CoA synthetase
LAVRGDQWDVVRAGALMIFLPRFDAAEIVNLPQAALMGVPTFYTGCSRAVPGEAADLRLFCRPGACWRDAQGVFDAPGIRSSSDGMTETNITHNPYAGERVSGAVGLPLPGIAIRIVDRDAAEASASSIGMIR